MKKVLLRRGADGRVARISPAQRAQVVELFYSSGLSQRAFATSQGFSLRALQSWIRQEKGKLPNVRFREIQLDQVPNPPEADSLWDAEVQLSSGTSVRVRGTLAREVIRRVLTHP